MGLLRLWLALCVVATHSPQIPGFRFMPGATAVCAFFVIAGFFAAYMIETRYRSRYRVFYLNRLIRIWPFYLLVLAGSIGIILLGYSQGMLLGPARNLPHLGGLPSLAGMHYWTFTQIFIVGQDLAFFLSFPPTGGPISLACAGPLFPNLGYMAILYPAWSLAVEEYFYLLAPWMNKVATWVAALLFAAWLLAYEPLTAICDLLPKQFPLIALLTFFGGLLAHRFYARHRERWVQHPRLAWAVPTAYGLFLLSAGFHGASVSLVVLATAAALPWVFELSRDRPWDRWIGDLSYPIYLLHTPLIWVMLWKAPLANGWQVLLASVLVAIVAAWAIERPLKALRPG